MQFADTLGKWRITPLYTQTRKHTHTHTQKPFVCSSYIAKSCAHYIRDFRATVKIVVLVRTQPCSGPVLRNTVTCLARNFLVSKYVQQQTESDRNSFVYRNTYIYFWIYSSQLGKFHFSMAFSFCKMHFKEVTTIVFALYVSFSALPALLCFYVEQSKHFVQDIMNTLKMLISIKMQDVKTCS